MKSRKDQKRITFGTSGIRGLTGDEITTDLSTALARACHRYFRDGPVVIGRDPRWGSESLYHAAASMFLSVGRDVYPVGLAPTGYISWFIRSHEVAGGFYITGSHTPVDRNGLLVIDPDGALVSTEGAKKIEKELQFGTDTNVSKSTTSDFSSESSSKIGGYQSTGSSERKYISHLLSSVNQQRIQQQSFAVGVDAASGTAGQYVESIFHDLEIEYHSLRMKPAPAPDRSPEPRRQTIRDLRDHVQKHHLDLGIAFDMDADRVIFVDEHGNVPSEDLIGTIFMQYSLPDRPSNNVVLPVTSSSIYRSVSKDLNITFYECPPGPPAMISSMKQHDAFFSAEESGKYIFSSAGYCSDGLYSMLKLLDILSKEDCSLSELTSNYPTFHQVKQGIECEEHQKDQIMSYVHQHFDDVFPTNNINDVRISGIKRLFPDHSWILIRPSGTEPIIRIYSDSNAKERAENLVDQGMNLVEDALNQIS